MAHSLVIGLSVLIVFLTCVIVSLLLYIQFKNVNLTINQKWFSNLLSEWKIELEDPSMVMEIMGMIRGQLLHHIMNTAYKKRSTFMPYKNDLIVYKSWTGFPVMRNSRSCYNPTWSGLHGVVLMRNDNISKIWESECYYDLASIYLNPLNDMPEISQANRGEHIAFKFNNNGFDGPKECAASRTKNSSNPIFEDLRFAVEWRSNFDPDTLPLITGVSLFTNSNYHTKVCVMTGTVTGVKSTAPSLRWVHDITSPTNAKTEKNWLFLQTRYDPLMYHIIYSIQPLAIYKYSSRDRFIVEGGPAEMPLTIPLQWKNDEFGKIPNMSNYRLNAIALVHNETELMLLMHRKESHLPFYVHYCLYLDPHTFRPLFYIPFPVLTEVAAKIVFPMSIVCTDRYYHICCGIMDEVAGILTYDVDTWEKSRIAF